MKIVPSKDYKKPLFAIGLSAVMMASAVTACSDPIQYAGDEVIVTSETEEIVQLDGDVAIAPDETDATDATCSTDDTLMLEGEAQPPQLTEKK